jgi:hypothetical protein
MKRYVPIIFAWVIALQTGATQEGLSLAGQWRFALDRKDAGLEERWFSRELTSAIDLPGSLPQRGIGDEVSVATKWTGGIVDRSFFTAPEFAKYREPGHVKVPFWLQPDRYYVGVAWFQRDITIPSRWRGKRVVLFLERPHWETRVWLDGKVIGTNNSLATPHQYDFGLIAPGKHALSIRVDNRMIIDVGENSHCISDHTQGNWNGIVGRIELLATPPVWIEDAQVYPHPAGTSAAVRVRIGNATAGAGQGVIEAGQTRQQVTWAAYGATADMEVPFQFKTRLWDEFSPALHDLELTLRRRVGPKTQFTFALAFEKFRPKVHNS